MTASLRVAGQSESVFPFGNALMIGSAADCEIRVRDAAPKHCRVARQQDGSYSAVDLTGQSFVQVNGKRGGCHHLQEGDTLKVGSMELVFSQEDPSVPEELVVVPQERTRTSKRIPLIPLQQAPASRTARRSPFTPAHAAIAGAAVLMIAVVLGVLLFGHKDAPPPRAPRETARTPRQAPVEPRTEAPSVSPPVPRPAADPGLPIPALPEPVHARPVGIEPRILIPERAPIVPAPAAEPAAVPVPVDRLASVSRGSGFAARYAALLLFLEDTLSKGSGFEAAHRKIMEFGTGDGPAESADHLRALAASFKKAVHCDECVQGRINCPQCKGVGRCDFPCSVCSGSGRVRPLGVIGEAEVTVKCRNCDGKKIFRDVGCPGCSRSGKARCPSCRGEPWRDRRCTDLTCTTGRIPCDDCTGTGLVKIDCPDCDGGRFRPSGAIGKTDVSVKCRTCDVDGKHGDGFLRMNCKRCSKTGKVTCGACGGMLGKWNTRRAESIPTSQVYTRENCGECLREPNGSCRSCLGLGVRLKPAAAPEKTISP